MFLKFITKCLLVLSLATSWAHATTIDYLATQLDGTRWRYDYTLRNDTLGSALEEFTIYFDEGLYANLAGASGPGNWDLLLIQPDTGIPAAGFFDGLALDGGLAAGASQGGFSVFFDYLGQGAPGAQQFSVVDPLSFVELDSGMTGSAAVPLPGTLSLLALGLLAGATVQRRRQGGRQ